MLKWLSRKDWRKSPAHLLLLSRFIHGDTQDSYEGAERWKAVLGESPARAINRFLSEGMLRQADGRLIVARKFGTAELKAMLKERGLKVSGSRADLAERLYEGSPDGFDGLTKDADLLQCTAEGERTAQNYLDADREAKIAAEQQVIQALKERAFSRAAMAVANYESTRVFARGIGVDWKDYGESQDVRSLQAIFTKKPGILRGVREEALEELRMAASLGLLWGVSRLKQWLTPGLETGIHLDCEAASRMLEFHAIYLRKLESLKQAGIKTAQIVGGWDENTCTECRKIAGKVYRLDEVTELPHVACTSPSGCRCDIVMGPHS